MPCSDGLYLDNFAEERLKERIDELTQNLCFLCINLKEAGLLETYGNPRIIEWHNKHMELDEERVRYQIEEYYKQHKSLVNSPKRVADIFINRAEKVHPVSEWHKSWFFSLSLEISEKMKIEFEKDKPNEIKVALNKLTKREKEILGLLGK